MCIIHLYCDILKEFGIYAVASEPEDDGHVNSIIVTKNKKAFVADLQLDLNIQTKSRLEHFEYLDPKALTKMLIEIGYIKDDKGYKNEREIIHYVFFRKKIQ